MKKFMFVLLAGLLATAGLAEVPRTINYQGRLTNVSGAAVADGTYVIQFFLYTAESGGTSIWDDTMSNIDIKNGYFNVQLGSNAAHPLSMDFSQQYWLGIKVGSDPEMMPRQAFNSVPYALNVAPAGLPGYLFVGYQILTPGATTYTPSGGVRAIMVECIGAGGGGGGAAQSTTTSGVGTGGGAGGYCRKWITNPASSYPVQIGSGGAGAPAGNNNGENGTAATTFGNGPIMTANAGGGGQGSAGSTGAYVNPYTGVGGIATGGDLNIIGARGIAGIQVALDQCTSGTGGESFYGTPGYGTGGGIGPIGSGSGAGGSGGAALHNTTDRTGGNGRNGLIVVWEYK